MFNRRELEKLYTCIINNAESVSLIKNSDTVTISYLISPKVENFEQLEEKNDYNFSIIFDWTFVSHKVDAAILYSFNGYKGVFDANVDTDQIVNDYFFVLNRTDSNIQEQEIRDQYKEVLKLSEKEKEKDDQNRFQRQPNDMNDYFIRMFTQQRQQEHQRRYLEDNDNDEHYNDLPF
jgi:hypothetical protein